MRCPFCAHLEDKVVDSRETREGDAIRRRRECLKCGRRFTSYERVEEVPLLIIKKDGRREPFDRQKLLKGMMAACQKRPVTLVRLEEAVADIQARLLELPDRELPSLQLGELVMAALKGLDSVAYVRFASIYRDFKDLPDFVKALETLMAGPQFQAAAASAPLPAAPAPSREAPASKKSTPLPEDEPSEKTEAPVPPVPPAPAAQPAAAPSPKPAVLLDKKGGVARPTPLFPDVGSPLPPRKRKR